MRLPSIYLRLILSFLLPPFPLLPSPLSPSRSTTARVKVKDAKRVLLFGSGRVAKPLMRLLGEVGPEYLVLPLLVSSSVLFSAIFPPSESLISSHLSHLPIPLFPTSPSLIPYLFLSLFLLPSSFPPPCLPLLLPSPSLTIHCTLYIPSMRMCTSQWLASLRARQRRS